MLPLSPSLFLARVCPVRPLRNEMTVRAGALYRIPTDPSRRSGKAAELSGARSLWDALRCGQSHGASKRRSSTEFSANKRRCYKVAVRKPLAFFAGEEAMCLTGRRLLWATLKRPSPAHRQFTLDEVRLCANISSSSPVPLHHVRTNTTECLHRLFLTMPHHYHLTTRQTFS